MPKAPDFPSDSQHAHDPRADDWHDLVAAVVAVKGSPPVRPPAALLTGLERKLGFDLKPAVWWRAPRLLAGVAAALALMAGGLAWRAGAPNAGLASTESVAGAGELIALRTESRETEGSVPTPESNLAQAPDARLAPSGPVASGAPSKPGQNFLAGPTQNSSREGDGTGRDGSPAGSLSSSGQIPAMPDASLRESDDPIDLKSDFYVVGIIAAALQSPVTANPYESSLQPVEWSDWLSGYELGRQLPPTEALALGEAWAWQDPGNLSLAIGIDEGGIGASAAVPEPGPKSPPEAVAGDAAAQGMAAPPSGLQPPQPDGDAAGENVAKKNGAE